MQNFTGTDPTNRRQRNRTVFGADHKSRGRRAEVMDISNAGAVMQLELISKNRILTELICYIYIYIYIYIYSWFFNILIYLNYVFTPITKWNSAVSPGCLKKKKKANDIMELEG